MTIPVEDNSMKKDIPGFNGYVLSTKLLIENYLAAGAAASFAAFASASAFALAAFASALVFALAAFALAFAFALASLASAFAFAFSAFTFASDAFAAFLASAL